MCHLLPLFFRNAILDSFCPALRHRRPLLKTIKQTNPWCKDIVELHEDDECNAHKCVYDAEQRAESIERLRDGDAACDRRTHFNGHIVFHNPRMLRILPTDEEHDAEEENIEPIRHQSNAQGDEPG